MAEAPSYNAAMDLDPARCYQAILSRDRRFDGRFFTGVVTTGIYCRPVCPVAPPKLRNMRFYACAAYVFPRPEVLAEADLAKVGMPRARAHAIRSLAAAVTCGELRFDASLGLDDAVERLCALPGVGPWTAHYIAMRGLGEPDAFPETDLGLRHALASNGAPASPAEVLRQAQAWRPWRSYATIYLWNSLTSPERAMEKAS